MPDSADSAHPRWWVNALDCLACALVLLAMTALVTGTGPRGSFLGIRISLTSAPRLVLDALLAIGLRHLLVRRPSLVERVRPVWMAIGARNWPWSGAPEGASLRRFTRASLVGWLWPALVVVLFCAPLFVHLGGNDLENDEAGYSYSVDTMLALGDWAAPKGIPTTTAPLDKPPLKIWLVAAPIRLGLLPQNEFGYRFWDAVFGAAAFLYVYAIGRMIGGPICGFVAVLVLFLDQSLLFDHGLRTNNMEAPLVLCYAGGVYHYLAWARKTAGGHGHAIGVGLYFVLGFMTKFVAAAFLPMMLAVALIAGGDLPRAWRDRRAWFAAAGVVLALTLPWFAYETYRYGAFFWQMMVGDAVYKRFTAGLDPSHLKPWSFYLVELLDRARGSQVEAIVRAGLALLLVRAVRGAREAFLLLLWFALPIGLMSAGSSKLSHYAYPFLAPLALAAGYVCAVGFELGWSHLGGPWPAVAHVGDRIGRASGRVPILRALLLVVAVLALALAALAYTLGPTGFGIRNALVGRLSMAGPALVAVLLFVLAGRLSASVRTLTVVLLLSVLPPLFIYAHELKRFPVERHELRSVRDCLQPISARFATTDSRGPGVWVDSEAVIHPHYYYLRDLGPWHKQEPASDALVAHHLYVPSAMRPVLLSNLRYEQIFERDRGGVVDVARKAAATPAVVPASTARDPVGVVRLDYGVLLLPGPYRSCAPETLRPAR